MILDANKQIFGHLPLTRGGYAILGFSSPESAEKAMSRNGQRLPQRKAAEQRESMTCLVGFVDNF